MRLKFLTQIFAVSAALVVTSNFSQAATPKIFDELPLMYQRAFRLNAVHEKDTLEVHLETLGGYFVYKDSLKVESENYNLKLKKGASSFKGLDPLTKKIKEF